MSKQAIDLEKVREGLKDVLLGPAQHYEALRAKGDQEMDTAQSHRVTRSEAVVNSLVCSSGVMGQHNDVRARPAPLRSFRAERQLAIRMTGKALCDEHRDTSFVG